MEFSEILNDLLKRKAITAYKLSKETGISSPVHITIHHIALTIAAKWSIRRMFGWSKSYCLLLQFALPWPMAAARFGRLPSIAIVRKIL